MDLKHSSKRRRLVARDVRVPELTVCYLGILGCMDFENLWISFHCWGCGVRMKRSKAFPKFNVLRRWYFLLLFEEQHLVGVKSVADLRKLIVRNRLAQIDSIDLGPKDWSEGFGNDGSIGVRFGSNHKYLRVWFREHTMRKVHIKKFE